MMAASMGPLLRSLRVLELGHYIAAPFATRVLADLGADVIKVEPPGTGDPVRTWGEQSDGRSLWWSVHGRNKRSLTADLKQPEGRDLVLALAAKCDVVVENYRAGQLEKLGLGPAELAAARPGIVVVRISGYGQTGPEARKAGFGVIGEAKGGLRHLCGYPKGESELPPVRMGVSVGDSISGLYGAIGALAAVLDQRLTGAREARVVDVALGESVLSFLEGCLPEYGRFGRVREPMGSRIATAAPTNAYPCKDGAWLLIAANSDPLWRALAEVMGRPELGREARFLDNQSRCRNVEELDRLIAAWTMTLDSEEAQARVEAANIPTTKIYTVADVAKDPQYRARKMVTEVTDPHHGALLHPGVVPMVHGLDRDAQIRWTGPDVGQHNDEVLGDLLGLSAAAIEDLRRRRVI
jgi:crotonobetainyl-CoA:carnitine CoA-transferase CaiB-like acyl-CoA transferase